MLGYVLTTPVLDEIDRLPVLVDSIDGQALRPALWLVVDDGSTDGSLEWLQQRAEDRPWMEVVPSPERSEEYLGHHIARVKAWGLQRALDLADERGLEPLAAGMLDADIRLPPDHYSRLVGLLEDDPRLGVVSSLILAEGDERVEALQRVDLARGGTMTFRRDCLDSIGGLPPYAGFDGAANVKAKLAGWKTRLLPDLVAWHARPTATRFGVAPGYRRKGEYAWFLDLHPAVVAARVVAYSMRSPHSAGVWFLRGWVASAMRRDPRCPDADVREYFRRERPREYVRRLFGGGPRFA